LNDVVFLSWMHCTGEHGKASRWLREKMDVKAVAGCYGQDTYLHYPNDLGYGIRYGHVQKLVKDADAVVLEEGLPEDYGIAPSDLEGKVVVRDAHGTFTRKNCRRLAEWDAAHSVVYRTADLRGLLCEDAHLSPCSIDFDDWLFRPCWEVSSKVVVAHAPTNRGIKGTHLLLQALKQFPDIELIISEREPNRYSLWNRRRANVYFDNIADGTYYGYKGVLGVAGIEAAAQGQAVIGDFTADGIKLDWSWVKDSAGVVAALGQLSDLEYRERMRSEWFVWVMEHRNRKLVMEEFYGWLCRQSPYSCA